MNPTNVKATAGAAPPHNAATNQGCIGSPG
jgi:hypothetical protein